MVQLMAAYHPYTQHMLLVAVHYMTDTNGTSSSVSVILLLMVVLVRLFFVPTFNK